MLQEELEMEELEETTPQLYAPDWEPRDRLFLTHLLLELTQTDLQAMAMTSQRLAEGARRSKETQAATAPLPTYIMEFQSVFAKEDFDILPEHRKWDHAIELIPGAEPKSSKVYPCPCWSRRSWTPSWRRTCIPDGSDPPSPPSQP